MAISIDIFAVLLSVCPEKFLSSKEGYCWQENKILTSAALLAQTCAVAFDYSASAVFKLAILHKYPTIGKNLSHLVHL